jgi:hypothetical protein
MKRDTFIDESIDPQQGEESLHAASKYMLNAVLGQLPWLLEHMRIHFCKNRNTFLVAQGYGNSRSLNVPNHSERICFVRYPFIVDSSRGSTHGYRAQLQPSISRRQMCSAVIWQDDDALKLLSLERWQHFQPLCMRRKDFLHFILRAAQSIHYISVEIAAKVIKQRVSYSQSLNHAGCCHDSKIHHFNIPLTTVLSGKNNCSDERTDGSYSTYPRSPIGSRQTAPANPVVPLRPPVPHIFPSYFRGIVAQEPPELAPGTTKTELQERLSSLMQLSALQLRAIENLR